MFKRFRRLRQKESIRNLLSEVELNIKHFIYPLFVVDGSNIKEEIKSMPEQYRYSSGMALKEIEELNKLGVKNILLFGIPEKKDSCGSEAYKTDGIIQKTVREIKKHFPDVTVVADVCMCEYTDSGHCGIIKNNDVDNDLTLEYLSKIALSYAESGVDIIAPSDMMDGRIGYIRAKLDENSFKNTILMSYSVKYSSAYYGPFRDAAGSTPQFGDRKTYQMDFRRKKEAFQKIEEDLAEGADIVMVKPALAYLDIISGISNKFDAPVAAYNVSGEYAMVKIGATNGLFDEKKMVLENLTAIKRAGANIIISYHTKDLAKWVKEGII
ncbi:MAG: delta-aminolevulinic acid dehydratase [Spirochaetes bacterium GWC1_27_15]|nr:MAG: delta-aminolevulinic acid dehydratase [Spirochaetes bacterium GWC1_27_15]